MNFNLLILFAFLVVGCGTETEVKVRPNPHPFATIAILGPPEPVIHPCAPLEVTRETQFE